MLIKNTNAASASADATTKRGGRTYAADQPKYGSALTAAIHCPKTDWVPLASAPLNYTSCGYLRSADEWGDKLRAKVEHFVTSISTPAPAWRITLHKNRVAAIGAMGMSTHIYAERGYCRILVYIADPDPHIHHGPSGNPGEFLNSSDWNRFPPQQQLAAEWHRNLARTLLSSLRRDFVEAVRSGSAYIMARQNTVLAPFERVTWDQWQYFELDEPQPLSAELRDKPAYWFDPGFSWLEANAKRYKPSTATGPNGEKLYAIHVAPGVDRPDPGELSPESGGLSPEEKCLQWIVEYMTAFPERAPFPRAALLAQAISMFPGLTQKGFERCRIIAQQQTGNRNWSRPGAPRKSPR